MTKELEDLGGNAMNLRACTCAWLAGFSACDIAAWNWHSVTKEDRLPLQHTKFLDLWGPDPSPKDEGFGFVQKEKHVSKISV